MRYIQRPSFLPTSQHQPSNEGLIEKLQKKELDETVDISEESVALGSKMPHYPEEYSQPNSNR